MQQILNTPLDTTDTRLYELSCQKCGAAVIFDKAEAITEFTTVVSELLAIPCGACGQINQFEVSEKSPPKRVVLPTHNRVPY